MRGITLEVSGLLLLAACGGRGGLTEPDGGTGDGGGRTSCDEVVLIPEGTFVMGQRGEVTVDCALVEGCAGGDYFLDSELPAHEVWVSGFWIQRTEVTVRCFQECVEAGECEAVTPHVVAPSDYMTNPENAERPAMLMGWEQAGLYCAFRGGRLPTEAEWEKAARGTDERRYPIGDTVSCEQADVGRSPRGCKPTDDDLPLPVTARPLDLSPYGVGGMTGGVPEWVADFWDPVYYSCGGPPWVDPQGPVSAPCAPELVHVHRGGNFDWPLGSATAWIRGVSNDGRGNVPGIRCAWDSAP